MSKKKTEENVEITTDMNDMIEVSAEQVEEEIITTESGEEFPASIPVPAGIKLTDEEYSVYHQSVLNGMWRMDALRAARGR